MFRKQYVVAYTKSDDYVEVGFFWLRNAAWPRGCTWPRHPCIDLFQLEFIFVNAADFTANRVYLEVFPE